MDLETRLKELGIVLPDPPAAVATYVRAVRFRDCLYISGQLPLLNGKLTTSGKLGAEVTLEEGIIAARQCTINALSVIKSELGSFDGVEKVIRLTGFVSSSPDFIQQPQVINGASDLLVEIFGDAGRHSRSAVGVATLPLGAPVEIDFIIGVS